MFGFLKQKIADFGSKLKQTISKEEEKEIKEEKVVDKKETPQAPKVQAKKEETSKPKEEKKILEKETISEIKTKKVKEIKTKEEPKVEAVQAPQAKKEIKVEEKVVTVKQETPKEAPPQPKKEGLLTKLFGIGKKETKTEEKPKQEVPKVQTKKKTREEEAEELEAKMFAEIEQEVKKEESKAPEIKVQEVQTPKEQAKKETAKVVEPESFKEIKQEELTSEEELEEEIEEVLEEPKAIDREEKARNIHITTLEEDKRELKANVGVAGGLKGLLFGGIEINEKQITDLLWDLELSLIESDVEADAANEIVKQIKQRLIGKKVSAKKIDEYLQEQIKEILAEMMNTEKINLLEETKTHKPLKILIIGPNGAGKTTSIAKLVNYFHKHKKTCIVAAADTFRAGAIDQLEIHANKLGVRVIKQQYGADPAAVAFDAVKAAEAGKIDVVLIDSAGRQETNKNLMEELRKIERVAKPDLKIYVGEAYVGQTLLDQVEEFKTIVGIDGFILTKIDTDAKGGTAISLLYKMKKPILFVGTGQGYDDFKEFTPEFILGRII
ncbi:MAG: signal recognition particle-docking protein FtsY [archaeon]|jgi:fused signal recognition particle receptor